MTMPPTKKDKDKLLVDVEYEIHDQPPVHDKNEADDWHKREITCYFQLSNYFKKNHNI